MFMCSFLSSAAQERNLLLTLNACLDVIPQWLSPHWQTCSSQHLQRMHSCGKGKKVKTAKMAKGRQTVSGRVQGLCYRLLNVTVTFYYSGTCNQNIFTNLSLCFCLFSLSQRCRQKLTKVYHERHHAVAVMVSVINSSSLDSSAACQF